MKIVDILTDIVFRTRFDMQFLNPEKARRAEDICKYSLLNNMCLVEIIEKI